MTIGFIFCHGYNLDFEAPSVIGKEKVKLSL
jgi:hypothetical protein